MKDIDSSYAVHMRIINYAACNNYALVHGNIIRKSKNGFYERLTFGEYESIVIKEFEDQIANLILKHPDFTVDTHLQIKNTIKTSYYCDLPDIHDMAQHTVSYITYMAEQALTDGNLELVKLCHKALHLSVDSLVHEVLACNIALASLGDNTSVDEFNEFFCHTPYI